MEFQNKNNTFKLVLTVGDESGIGPEIILKALSSNEITKNIDAGAFFSSIYLTISVDGKINLGPIWDFDLSMAGDHEGWWIIGTPWFELLLQDPYFVDRVKQRFEHFYANKAEILDKVDAFGKYLELASERNDLKWQTIGTYVFPNPTYFESYDQELHFLKTWIADRMEWLKQEMSEL